MKHVFRKLTVFLLVLAIVLSMLPAVFAAVGTLKPNSGTRDQLCTELSAKAKAYYTGSYSYENLAALGGATDTSTSYNAAQNNPLYTALNKLMTVTHTNQNVRYDGYAANSLATYWVQTDTENSASTYLFFYTDILASDPLVSGLQMQREHVWPKSRASYYQKGGGSDLHHLRPSIGGVNASKSNNAFANLNGTGSAYTVSGMSQPSIWTGSKDGVGGVLEVRDNVKGDVARILLYVYVRWQQPNLYSDVAANLLPEMDPDDSQNTGGRAIESLSTLLQWMQKDPVDTWEMSRNDQIENVQGNRNVFIDYPELAYLMFNWPIPTMTTPSGIAAGTAPTTPTEPTTAPTEPTTAPTTPTAAPTEPTTAPTEPTEATEPRGDEYALTTTVKDGDEIVIFNPASGKAMSEDAVSNVYRAGVSATVLNNNIYTDDSKIVWTVGKTADGYTFTNDKGETLSATTGLSFAATDNVWAINPAATANSVYLVSTSAVGTSGDPKYVEWYGRYNEFSTYYYSASLESDFALQLFVKTGNVAPEPTEPTTAPTEPTTAPTEPTTAPTEPTTAPTQPTTAPTEPTTAPTQPTTAPTEPTTAPTEPTTAPDGSFVLSNSIKDGDQVVIYNPGHGMAVKDENEKNWYLVPQAVTPSGNKIANPDASIVWTVVDNGNGTYSFTNGSDKIVMWVSGNYFELTNDPTYAGANGEWKVTWTDGLAYIQHATFSNSYGPAYMECYTSSAGKTNISGYSTSDPTAKSNDYGFQFFVKSGSTTPTEPTTAPTTPGTYYTITWYVDGRAYREQCAKGEIPTFSGSTDKPADDKYTYTFAGWQPTPVPAYADATYVATYTKEPVQPEGGYLITWVVNGKETTIQYEAGVYPVYPGSTDRPDDENYVYCFAGWSPAVEKVTKNATYTAQYNKIPLHKVEDFIDVPKDMWCYDEVTRAAQLGLFNGMSYRHFEPNGDVSRAMIVTVLYRMEGQPEVKLGRTFSDVPDDQWYSDAVLWASNAGIAKGLSENLFAPNEPVTREQFAAFLYRYAEWKGYDVSAQGKLNAFADRSSISDYAKDALYWAVGSDLLRGMEQNGKLCLVPQGTATRAQAASIMVRFFNAFIK